MKTAVHILIGTIVLLIALSFILVYVNTRPPRYALNIPPSRYQSEYEDVSFVTIDDIALKGWVIAPPGRKVRLPAVVVCHGLGANRSDLTDLAVQLSRRGYLVLAFDFRAHGESSGSRSSLGHHEQKDIKAALRYLLARGDVDPKRIGIFGFSMGGAAAIMTAADTGSFAAVVADSAFTSLRDQARQAITGFYHLPSFPFLSLTALGYRLYFFTAVDDIDPEKAVARLAPVPVLIIAGEGDDLIPVENGKRLYAAAREPKDLWLIPVRNHGGTIASAGADYEKRVGEFLDRYLKRQE